jgi:class 3 adenylate cyclase/tetratricopeptide (TPR) repeat protein
MKCESCGFDLYSSAKFCSECGEPVAKAASRIAENVDPPSAAPSVDGERRQLTVLFCDLIGSTAMASRLDPEDWREVIRAYQDACSAVADRFGGYIAQFLGDGIVVYFGFPVAHEDAALRAMRAGLGMVEAVGHVTPRLARHGVSLAVRIGVHTGTVVVGEVGSAARKETLALGDTSNVAARLQELAEPNTVVLSGTTFRLVRGHFVTEDRGVQKLKGIEKPVAVYRALRPVRFRSATTSVASSSGTPFVGRSEELDVVVDRWSRAEGGHGQVVLLSGEAGIGKSRLVLEFRERVAESPHTWLECSGSAYTVDNALYPVIALQDEGLGLGRFAQPEQKTARLERALEQVGLNKESHLPLFTELHSLPLPARYASLDLTPEAKRRRTLDALADWLLRVADEQPLVVVVEDLHWVDPTTLELLGNLIEQSADRRVFLVLTHRSSWEHPWKSTPHVSEVSLSRLSQRDATALASSLELAGKLSRDVLDEIVKRSDGIPLYVEELTRTVLDVEPGSKQGSYVPLVPTTLKDSLMARLDQLGDAKEVAQLGATLGREFSLELLGATSPMGADELRLALDRLVSAEIILKRADSSVYSFKHALIQEQAYESLLKAARQAHHRCIADVIASKFANIATAQPDLLAHHYDAAGIFDQALGYWLQAGQRSIGRSAHVEASRQLQRGLDALSRLAESPDRDQQELLLLTMRGVALIGSRGYAAGEVEHAFARARGLCQKFGDTPHLFPVLFGLWLYYLVRADGKSSGELCNQMEAIAATGNDPEYMIEAHSARASIAYWVGSFSESNEHILRARLLYDPSRHAHHPYVYGQDPLALGYSYAALGLWFLGFPEQAAKSSVRSLELAGRTNHPLTIAGAYSFATDLNHQLKNRDAFSDLAQKTWSVATEQNLPMWAGWSRAMRGYALFESGERDAGIREIQAGLDAFRATGAKLNTAYLTSCLVEAYLAAGKLDLGLEKVDEALSLLRDGDRYYHAEILRLKGELIRGTSGNSASESAACFDAALSTARLQGAKSLELRAAMSMGRLWFDAGSRSDAISVVSGVYDWFTEGLDTKDLVDAKGLVDGWRAA